MSSASSRVKVTFMRGWGSSIEKARFSALNSFFRAMTPKGGAVARACRGSGLRHGALCNACQGKGYRLCFLLFPTGRIITLITVLPVAHLPLRSACAQTIGRVRLIPPNHIVDL
jgi:hypothetical protein